MRCLLALEQPGVDLKLAEFVEDKAVDHELLEKNAHLLKEVTDRAAAKKKLKKAQVKNPTVEIFYKPKEDKSQRKLGENLNKHRAVRSNSLKQTKSKKTPTTFVQSYQSHSLQRIKPSTSQSDKHKASSKPKLSPIS